MPCNHSPAPLVLALETHPQWGTETSLDLQLAVTLLCMSKCPRVWIQCQGLKPCLSVREDGWILEKKKYQVYWASDTVRAWPHHIPTPQLDFRPSPEAVTEWTGTEAEAPILWLSIAKSQLIGKDPDDGTDRWQEEKGTTSSISCWMAWDGWMSSLTQWTWVWANSGRQWKTGRPGLLQYMQSQRVSHDWVTQQQQIKGSYNHGNVNYVLVKNINSNNNNPPLNFGFVLNQ